MKVLIPTQLQSYTHGDSQVEASGQTLAAVLEDLDLQFPGIRFRVVDEQDRIREHIRVFVGGENARQMDVSIATGDEVQIVGALSGG